MVKKLYECEVEFHGETLGTTLFVIADGKDRAVTEAEEYVTLFLVGDETDIKNIKVVNDSIADKDSAKKAHIII